MRGKFPLGRVREDGGWGKGAAGVLSVARPRFVWNKANIGVHPSWVTSLYQ